MESALARYLGVFLPFIATLVCAHFIVRSSPSLALARMGLSSPQLLRRALVATGIAVALIVTVDVLTDGALFLRPRFPESQLLVSLILVAVVLTFTVGRAVSPMARRLFRDS
ncbi:MAG TPA: hypothetical protein VF998_07050 [Candidatus Limnocylindria bacterium]